jgi:phage shock protein PspC (stress-responsive transcriptional regulator)
MTTTAAKPVFLGRPDTLLGVCESIGRDFGFNPDYLRVAVSIPVLFNPALAIGAYATLGLFVLVSRLLAPAPRVKAEAEPVAAAAPVQPLASNDTREDLPLAA